MKLAKRRSYRAITVVGAILALSGGALVAIAFPASATATPPPWVATEQTEHEAVGTVSFYNSSGVQIFGGALNAPLAPFAVASGGLPGASVASSGVTVYMASPQLGEPASFFEDTLSAAAAVPYLGTLPAPLTTMQNAGHLVVPVQLGYDDYATDGNPSTYPSWTTTYEVRIQGNDVSSWYSADIQVDTVANTWTQVYPAPPAGPTATTTTLAAVPASSAALGASVALTATISPTAAGSVQFMDGSTAIGTPVAETTGTAMKSTTTLTAGPHSITAVFTPTSPTAFSGSTSSALSYTITSPATPTVTTLTANPTGPITVGTSTTLTAMIAPSAAGTVQFKDGATNLGTAVTVSGGQAVSAAQMFAVGTHSLSAVFTSSDTTAFTSSTGTLSYVVNPAPATTTTTGLVVSPSSPQTFGTSVTLDATVTPSNAVGSVRFLDGSTVLATVAAVSGLASTSTTTLGAGSHSLTAQFVPTVPANFGTSTSSVTTYVINAATTSLGLVASPLASANQGAMATFTATVTPAVAGTVQFKYLPGDVNIGAAATVTAGVAHVTTSTLPLSTTGVEAIFTPTSGNYSASPNTMISYTINPPPPGTTTTALTVTPVGGQANQGTLETLKATITPANAGGTVQFMDGSTPIGSPVTVAAGVAQTTTTLALGSHSIVAMFVSGNQVAFSNSNSSAVSYTVLPPATTTTTGLAITPGASEPFGTEVTFTATVTPAAAGTVTFKEGTTTLGSAPTVLGASDATAAFSTVGLAGGAHSVIASFTPTAPLSFTASASAAGSVTITAITTTTSLAVTPSGPVTGGASVTLKATVTPTGIGSVRFFDGSTSLGTVAVNGSGVATLVTTKIGLGARSLKATFTATHTNDYTTSTSAAVALSVLAPPVIDSAVNGGKQIGAGAKVVQGSTIQLHASGFQPGESVKVYLHSIGQLVETVNATSAGDVTANVAIPASFPLGSHTITLVGSLGSVAFAIDVVAKSGGGVLATTGVNVQLEFVLGLLLLVAGALLIGGGRFRGRRVTAQPMHRLRA